MTSTLQVSETPDPLFSSLIESGQLSLDAFSRARRLATEAGEPVPATLTRLDFVSEQDMAEAFASALGLPVCTENLNTGVVVMKSAQDGA